MTLEIGLLPLLHALLGSVRVLVMMVSGPLFSHPGLSGRVRIMLALMVAFSAAPVGVGGVAEMDWDLADVAMALVVEVLIGLAIGVGSGLVFAGFLQLGQFMAIQGGLGLAQSIDPATGASTVALSTALNTFAMLVFLVIGGHHELVLGIAASFQAYPVGGAGPDSSALFEIAQLGSVVWLIAFQLAAPVTVAIFVQNVATGVLGRAMPQLNLLIVNLPLHVGMLFLIVGLGANDFLHVFQDALELWPSRVFEVLMGGVDGG